MPKAEPVEVRLWRRVDKSDECWIWTGTRTRQGYGLIWTRSDGSRRHDLVHRLSWVIENGPVPDGLEVLHRCDNPPCVNPDHLFIGTQADNRNDKVAKGRQYRPAGERNPKVRLTANQVAEIRARYEPGRGRPRKDSPRHWTTVRLAEEYGVSQSAIAAIVSGRSWD